MMKALTSLQTSKPTKLAGISPKTKKIEASNPRRFLILIGVVATVGVGGGVAVEKAEKSEEFQKQILDSTWFNHQHLS